MTEKEKEFGRSEELGRRWVSAGAKIGIADSSHIRTYLAILAWLSFRATWCPMNIVKMNMSEKLFQPRFLCGTCVENLSGKYQSTYQRASILFPSLLFRAFPYVTWMGKVFLLGDGGLFGIHSGCVLFRCVSDVFSGAGELFLLSWLELGNRETGHGPDLKRKFEK